MKILKRFHIIYKSIKIEGLKIHELLDYLVFSDSNDMIWGSEYLNYAHTKDTIVPVRIRNKVLTIILDKYDRHLFTYHP